MDLPRYHRLRGSLYRLEGSRCDGCEALHFPARPVCPECGSRDLSPHGFEGRGELWSYSELYQAQRGYPRDFPNLVGLVKLEEGPLVLAQLTDADPQELKIGMKLEMVTRLIRDNGEAGYRVYGYKFRPPIQPS